MRLAGRRRAHAFVARRVRRAASRHAPSAPRDFGVEAADHVAEAPDHVAGARIASPRPRTVVRAPGNLGPAPRKVACFALNIPANLS